MSLKRKGNIEAVLQMPDGTEDQVRAKLNALIRELFRETDYIEQNITVDYGGMSLPAFLKSIADRLTAHGI